MTNVIRFILFVVLTIPSASFAVVDDVPATGLYGMKWNGTGRVVPRADTDGTVVLGRQRSTAFEKAKLVSIANDNSRFRLEIIALNVAPPTADAPGCAIVVAGYCLPAGSQSDVKEGGWMSLAATVRGEDVAARIAKELGIVPEVRSHPGHRLLVSVRPERTTNAPGEAVTLVMTIKNVGGVRVQWGDGGSQRGARNNQFDFTARGNSGFGAAIPDVGDPTNFGGMIGPVDLKPGDVFEKKVEVTKWFKFAQPDTYRVTAMYQMPLGGIFERSNWDETAVAACDVRIEAPKPDAATTRP